MSHDTQFLNLKLYLLLHCPSLYSDRVHKEIYIQFQRSKGRKQEGSHVLEAGSEQVLGEVKINKYFCKVIKTAHLGLQSAES